MSACALTYRTAIDWIELEIQLSRQSNFWTVQDALRAALQMPHQITPFVEAINSGSGNAASAFRFRIQNPMRLHQLTKALDGLSSKFGLEDVKLTAVELAFDTYHHGGGLRQLAELAADRFRFITAQPGDDWYFYRRQKENRRYVNTLPQRRELVEHFEHLWQLTDRNSKDTDVRYHAYVKTQDNGKALVPSRYCARLEVTLRGVALPFRTVAELATFNFAKLAHHFKFRRLADDLHPAVKQALASWSGRQHGRSGRYRRPDRHRLGRYSGTSVFRASTVADDELNATVYECLRKLTRDWRSQKRNADFPEVLCP
jgi:hypothetical protein